MKSKKNLLFICFESSESLAISFVLICVTWRDSFLEIRLDSKLPFIDFFGYIEFHLLYFLMENLAVEAQMQMVRSNFCLKLKWVAEWGQSGMQSLQTTFHSSFFVFKWGMQTSKIFSLLYIQDWIRNVCKGIFQKKERDLNSFAVTFQVTVFAFKKSLKLLNLRFWSMDEWNLVAKSFRTQ